MGKQRSGKGQLGQVLLLLASLDWKFWSTHWLGLEKQSMTRSQAFKGMQLGGGRVQVRWRLSSGGSFGLLQMEASTGQHSGAAPGDCHTKWGDSAQDCSNYLALRPGSGTQTAPTLF